MQENLINNLDYKDNTKFRPCLVLQKIGGNIIALEITSKPGKFNLALKTNVGNFKTTYLKMSYIFTIDYFKFKDKISKNNEKLCPEDREMIIQKAKISRAMNNQNDEENIMTKSEKQNIDFSNETKTCELENHTMVNKLKIKYGLLFKKLLEKQEYVDFQNNENSKFIKGSKMENQDFINRNLDGLFIKNSNIPKILFSKSSMKATIIKSSKLNDSNFDDADLTGSIFVTSSLKNVSFKNANLTDVKFIVSDLKNSDFTGAIFKNTSFKCVKLNNAILDTKQSKEINFINTKL